MKLLRPLPELEKLETGVHVKCCGETKIACSGNRDMTCRKCHLFQMTKVDNTYVIDSDKV